MIWVLGSLLTVGVMSLIILPGLAREGNGVSELPSFQDAEVTRDMIQQILMTWYCGRCGSRFEHPGCAVCEQCGSHSSAAHIPEVTR